MWPSVKARLFAIPIPGRRGPHGPWSGSAAPQGKTQRPAYRTHPLVGQRGDAPAHPRLVDGDDVVKIDGAGLLQAICNPEDDLRGHVPDRGRERGDRDPRQVMDGRVAVEAAPARGPVGRLEERPFEDNLDRFHMWSLLTSKVHSQHWRTASVVRVALAKASSCFSVGCLSPRSQAGNCGIRRARSPGSYPAPRAPSGTSRFAGRPQGAPLRARRQGRRYVPNRPTSAIGPPRLRPPPRRDRGARRRCRRLG
jgi:hypothetical protein